MRYCFLRFPNGLEKALTLSYDDGCADDEKLIKIADKYGIKVTLNINGAEGGIGDDGWHLSLDRIIELTQNGGHEIAVHGARHIALGRASAVVGIGDVLACRKGLERKLGKIVRGYAYPDSGITKISGGVSKEEIKGYLKTLGMAYARTLNGDNDRFELPEDFYEWVPTAHHTNPELMKYLEKFLNEDIPSYCAARAPKLFYLWGHSFEFKNNNNWELLENFCCEAGGRDDVWYATNIEICDYVNAYYSLQFNADNNIVFNPTCREIWFEADGKLMSVKSGETKIIKQEIL